jgi:hypothetical protein
VQEKASIANHVGEIFFSQTTGSYFFVSLLGERQYG